MSNMIVAETILHQLGGPRFQAMTGARSFVGSANSLTFRLPARFAGNGIVTVRIVLEPSDTYRMECTRHNGTVAYECSDIYADNLQRVFTMATGLDTSLGRVQRAS